MSKALLLSVSIDFLNLNFRFFSLCIQPIRKAKGFCPCKIIWFNTWTIWLNIVKVIFLFVASESQKELLYLVWTFKPKIINMQKKVIRKKKIKLTRNQLNSTTFMLGGRHNEIRQALWCLRSNFLFLCMLCVIKFFNFEKEKGNVTNTSFKMNRRAYLFGLIVFFISFDLVRFQLMKPRFFLNRSLNRFSEIKKIREFFGS